MTNYAVVGLKWGDEGKGATVDYLCRTRDVGLVVRFNGGGQAGHNVVTEDGRHHTFSQWGSGTLAGVPTFLSRFMVVDPLALVPEAEHLSSVGVSDPWSMLHVDHGARVLTRYHRALQRLRETAAGDGRHGTCGTGFGEVVRHSLERPDVLRWSDLFSPSAVLERRLRDVQAWCISQASRFNSKPGVEWRDLMQDRSDAAIELQDVAEWAGSAGIGTLADPSLTGVVFEGAQGVLLDENYGFHPHTTWSTTTFANADALASEAGLEKPYRMGVTRSYSMRHGPGPFPTEGGLLPGPEPHNGHDDWRGGVRYGPLDLVLLRYAVDVCGGVDGVALTHLDAPRVNPVMSLEGPTGVLWKVPVPPTRGDLGWQEALGRWLSHASPSMRVNAYGATGDHRAYCVHEAARAPVVIESYGPTAAHRREKAEVLA